MKRERLSIGIFIDTFFPMIDGVVVTVDNYATMLSKDHDVTVFTVKPTTNYAKIDRLYKIVRCRTIKIPFTEYAMPFPLFDRKFKTTLRKCNFDIIHIHSPFGVGEIGTKYALKKNIPLLSTYHSQYKQDFKSRSKSDLFTDTMMKKIIKVFNRCELSYAVNRKVKDVYEEYGSKVEIVVRNNGTDLKYYDNEEEIIRLRKKHNIMKDEKILLFVGRIDVLKNVYFIMNALKLLKDMEFKFKMVWVGNGPNLEELQKLSNKLGLNNENIYTGKIIGREEISKYYNMADLFMFPSLYDASSLVQIEAASQKTPSIFLEGAVTADTIEKNVNGYTSKNDVTLFANEVYRLFNDKNEYKQVCINTFNDIYVTWDTVVKQTLDDYYKLIEKRTEYVDK